MHQREWRAGVGAVLVVQRSQRGQGRLLVARQHVAGMRCFGKALMRDAEQLGVAVVGDAAVGVATDFLRRLRLQAGRALKLLEQVGHRTLVQRLGNGEACAPGVLQKAGDVGAEPGFVRPARRPQAEATLRLLHAGEATESRVEALGAFLARQRLHAEGFRARLVDEDQRVGAAGGLLEAAVGVHQQALHGVSHVDGRLVRQRQGHRCRAGPQSLGQRRVELDEAIGFHAQPARFAQQRRHRLHLQRGLAHDLEGTGRDRQLDGSQTVGVGRLGREAQHRTLLVGQLHGRGAAGDLQRGPCLDRHAHLLRRTGQVGDVECDGGGVSRRDEAGHGQLGDDGRSHRHLGRTAGVAVGGARHGHQAQGAVEVGQRQRDGRLAVGIERHRAAEQVDQPNLARQALCIALAGVAAEALLGHVAFHALDQLAVQVLHVGVVAVLAEEVVGRVGRGKARDVEDAHIHRRHGDDGAAAADGLAGRIGHLHFHRHALLGHRLGRRVERHLQLARITCERQMHQAERARRRHAVALAARAKGHHADVQVVPIPAGVDRDLDLRSRRLHADAFAPQHPVAFDRDQRFAVVRRGHGEPRHITALERRAFELQADTVWAIAQVVGVLRAPAGIETVARDLPGVGVDHLDAVAAVLHRQRDLAARGQREAAGFGQFFLFGEAARPAATLLVTPVPLAVLTDQAHLQFLGRAELALGVAACDLEIGQSAFAHHVAVEQRADAHQHRRWPPGPLDRTHHRSASRFQQAEARAQLHRRTPRRHVDGQRYVGVALLVELGLGRILALLGAVVVEVAEDEPRPRLGLGVTVSFSGDAGQQSIACCGGAVQVGAVDSDGQGLVTRLQRRLGGLQLELHALGQELLDLEAPLRIRSLAAGVGARLEQPAAGGGVGRQRQRVLVVGRARTRRPHDLGRRLFSVGLLQCERDARPRLGG